MVVPSGLFRLSGVGYLAEYLFVVVVGCHGGSLFELHGDRDTGVLDGKCTLRFREMADGRVVICLCARNHPVP